MVPSKVAKVQPSEGSLKVSFDDTLDVEEIDSIENVDEVETSHKR